MENSWKIKKLKNIISKNSLNLKYQLTNWFMSIAYQLITLPSTLDYFSVIFIKSSLTMNHIMIKLSYIFLPVHKIKCAESFFEIVLEFSLVLLPMFLKEIKICEVKWVIKWNWIFIINSTFTRKCIVLPISFICKLFVWIVQSSIAVHCSILSISIINSSVRIAEFSFSMSKAILFLSCINTGILILFCDNFYIWIALLKVLIWHLLLRLVDYMVLLLL